MTSIGDYKNRIKRSGTIANSTTQHSIHSVSTFFKHSPSYEEVALNDNTILTPCQIVSNGKDPTIKTLILYPGLSTNTGSLVKRSNGDTWICESVDPNAIYTSSQIKKCNLVLKWMDKVGKLKEIPCVIKGMTGLGVDEDQVMNLPAGKREITAQRNSDTLNINRGQRFFVGPVVFEIIDIFPVEYEGLIKFILKEGQIDKGKDNEVLGITDYFSAPPSPPLPDNDEFLVEINGGNSIVFGRTSTYSAIFKQNGQIVSDESMFSLSTDEGSSTVLAEIVSQDSFANTCVVKAGSKAGYVLLHVKGANSESVKRIQIKPLF